MDASNSESRCDAYSNSHKFSNKLWEVTFQAMAHYQKLRYSFDFHSKENLDYLYQRINLLDEEARKGDAQSLADEFHEVIDELWGSE